MIKSLLKFKDKHPDGLKRVRSLVLELALGIGFFVCTPVIANVVTVPSSMVEPGKLEYVADLLDRCPSPTWMGRSAESSVLLMSRLVLSGATFAQLYTIKLVQCDSLKEIALGSDDQGIKH